MLGFHRRAEGTPHWQGINWMWDQSSKPQIGIKLGRLLIWFRRRSAWIMSGYKAQNQKANRYFFEIVIVPKPNLSILPWKRWD